jgi:ATP-binding cassette subfamily B (MDR/TAP) protein 1
MDGDPEKRRPSAGFSGVPDADIEKSSAKPKAHLVGQSLADITKSRHSSSGSDSTISSDDAANLKKLDSQVIQVPKEEEAEAALAHLPEHERKIISGQLRITSVKVTYFTLFRYATTNDILILVISAICAIAGGAAMPLFTVIYFFWRLLFSLSLTGHLHIQRSLS